MQGRRARKQVLATLAVAAASVLLGLPALANGVTVLGHPLVGKGPESSFTVSVSWANAPEVVIVDEVVLDLSGDDVTAVEIGGVQQQIVGSLDLSVDTYGAWNFSTGVSGSGQVTGGPGPLNATGGLNGSVYYHDLSRVEIRVE